jgi:hypothetical protein
MTHLDLAERKRLTSILGMLGSNAVGERDNAARLAEHFRREHGLTWAELLNLPTAPVAAPAPRAAPEPPVWKPRSPDATPVVEIPIWFRYITALACVPGVRLFVAVLPIAVCWGLLAYVTL